ncbi:MAG: phage antirepressor protein [Nanoarchaeota archaeon]|nr:phage antirepressor protein [Nanoarchaeota archaeon]MBU1322132.1 phage antirepressor protein [Nanoarchaeota archaeon]MBU1597600.1 phage antirepressor protein [Nanoarchaeota archaeon]MBU2442092.1 phage antirepressor protein [Nanoarchaeota archaeon]
MVSNDSDKALVVFEGKQIRRIWHDKQWFFSVVDVIAALTDSVDAKDYWYRLKKREIESSGVELSTFCRQLKLMSSDGKKYLTDCADTKSIFRIIQSIPSKKAEPFKLWLAKVGYERVQEIQDPELAQKRMKELYRAKGYSDEWIEKRVRGIAVRQELTDEWRNRKVDENVEFAILTNEISKATFNKTVEEYKEFKNLKKQNLRDHMNDLELIFTMLGEKVTSEITKTKDSQGFKQCEDSAKKGGKVAGNARKDAEKEIGKPIVSDENYLSEPEKVKRKRLK